MAFADNLKQLPAISHLAELQLIDASGVVVATIENKPGKAGSPERMTTSSPFATRTSRADSITRVTPPLRRW